MGQLLIIEGEDFSGNPNAVNINEFPVVTDSLIGFYAGNGSQSDANGIVSMPSIMVEGQPFVRIPGQTRSPVHYSGSTVFKGGVLRSADDVNTSAPGLDQRLSIDYTSGISFTFMTYRPQGSGPTGSVNRCILAIESIALQFRTVAASGGAHLAIGSNGYDVGFGGRPSATEAITVVLTKTNFGLYVDGALLSNTNISGENLPDSGVTRVIYGSNWNGASGLQQNQTKQIQIHNKALSLGEIQDIHSVLPNLLL